MFNKTLRKQQKEKFRRFYERLKGEEMNVIVCYKEKLYSMLIINFEIKQKTKLGKELYLYLEKIGLIRKW